MDLEKGGGSRKQDIQLVTFKLGEENYGIPVWMVKEIIRPMETFHVPGMENPLEGVINLRGEIVPVIRIHEILGIETELETEPKKRRVIILDSEGGGFGFIVDQVMEVVRVSPDSIKSSPDIRDEHDCGDTVIGIIEMSGRMIVCIDPGKLVYGMQNIKELASDCKTAG